MEFLNIIIQISIFLLLSCLPFSHLIYQNNILKNLKVIDYLAINFLFLLNIILIFSIFNFDKQIIFLSLLILSVLVLFFLIIKKVKIYDKALFFTLFIIIFFVSIDIANTF